jgi:ABC-type multidrug transport system fused ATPase/permease subunit
MAFIVQTFRNRYIHFGYITSIKLRRTLCAVLFDQISGLSVQALAETNSGKLVSLISSDLFVVERSLSFMPMIIVCPIANTMTYVIIGLTLGWISAAIVFACFIFAFTI